MKDLVVKTERTERDFAEIQVFVRTTWVKGELAFNRQKITARNLAGKLQVSIEKPGKEGFLCAECKTPELADTENGAFYYSLGKGLCAACASTEEIFTKWIECRDLQGKPATKATEYLWKGSK